MNERYSRQSFLGNDAQDRIEAAVIGVAGLGGGGSHAVQQLSHIGFRNFELFDGDRVEDSNLNRLIGATVGDARARRPKIEVAARMIRGLQPKAVINAHFGKWQEHSDRLKRCHIIFGCVDGYSERDQLEQFARRYLIGYIDIGMDVIVGADGQPVVGGQVIVSMPGRPCMRCMGFITPEKLSLEAQRYGDAGSRPQVVWPNGILASSAVGFAMDLLCNWTSACQAPVFLEYDGNKGTLRHRARQLNQASCMHFLPDEVGEPQIREI